MHSFTRSSAAASVSVLLAAVLAAEAHTQSGATTKLVSVSSSGGQASVECRRGQLSADGGHVVFESLAHDLVNGDTNNAYDIFVRDLSAGTTERVSVSSTGTEGNGHSRTPSISGDGRLVAFASSATNLASFDLNAVDDIFVHDRVAKTTTRISVSSTGAEATGASVLPVISGDGSVVAFGSRSGNFVTPSPKTTIDSLYVHELSTGQTTLESYTPGGAVFIYTSTMGELTPDGRYIAFANRGVGNMGWRVYHRDRVTSVTTEVSVDNAGSPGFGPSKLPSISDDGRYVAFQSQAADLIVGDTNGVEDVFLRDVVGGTTTRVSLDSAGLEATDFSASPSISGDGRWIAFTSAATNLIANDTNADWDVFLRDTLTGKTTRLSVDASGAEATGRSANPSLDRDGERVAFESTAPDLVSGDTNGQKDVFLRHWGTRSTPYCTAKPNSLGCSPAIEATGVASATAASGFTLTAQPVINNKAGLFFYSVGGAQASVSFQCGTLCVGPSGIRRTPVQVSGGNPPPWVHCSGAFTFDMNAFASGASGGNPSPALTVAGTLVHCQAWGRDQGFNPPCNTTLSNGLEYVVGP